MNNRTGIKTNEGSIKAKIERVAIFKKITERTKRGQKLD